MAFYRTKYFWAFSAMFGLLFAILLSIRIDLFRQIFSDPNSRALSPRVMRTERDTWMNIFQNDRKIGYSHSVLSKTETGYHLLETLYMRINTMGMAQDVSLKTEGRLYSDFTLSSFAFEISSGRFRFAAKGSVVGDVLSIKTNGSGTPRQLDIPAPKGLFLFAGIADAVTAAEVKPSDVLTFDVFNPASMGQESVAIRVTGKEDILNQGLMRKATKVSLTFKGATQFAWIGEDGETLMEKGLLGLRLEKTTRDDALFGFPIQSSQDLTEVAAVSSNVIIENPEQLSRLKVRFDGLPLDNLRLDGGRQALDDSILTITKESLSNLSSEQEFRKRQSVESPFLAPSLFIQSDHPNIRHLAQTIVAPDDAPLTKAQKLVSWIYEKIEKRPVLSMPDALSTLENRIGDCNEHAVLLAALARAAGIPAKVEAGLVYLNGRFYYHAWNLLFLGKWVTADSLFDQIPADVTHIRFSSGTESLPLDLMSAIENVKLTIVQ